MMVDKQQAQSSSEEKLEQRFNLLLKPADVQFISPQAEENYQIRAKRLVDVYKVEEPDRIPVMISVGAIPALLNGLDGHTAMYDYDKLARAYSKFNDEYAEKLETFSAPAMGLPGAVYDLLDFKQYVWPGHGLSLNATTHQFVEGEYMRADEYDALIKDPSDFLMRVYLPRAFGIFQPYQMLSSLINLMELPHMYFTSYATPSMQKSLRKQLKVGKELSKWTQLIGAYSRQGAEMGYPAMMMGGIAKAPFDTLGDTMRGTRGIIKDMYNQPDKLLKALDVIADMTIDSVITSTNTFQGLMALFPLHKGADGFMSPKQFDTFYWPPLKKIIDAANKEGIIVSLFAEGSYNSRLEKVNEFPKGMVHWWFDQTDMAKAKEMLGDKCCIQGNVPASMLVTGTPKEVKEYCHKLIEVCGKGGGYILSAGANSDEAKLENLLAMVEAAKQYGVYK